MVCLVMLSAGSAFAADDSADILAVDDEIAVDEGELAVEQDTQLGASSSDVVTPDTFSNYFSDVGVLLENVTSEELIFEGTFENLDFKDLTIDRPISLTGNNVTFNGISLLICADNVTVSGFEIIQNDSVDGIFIGGSDVTIANSTVYFVDNGTFEAFAIRAVDSNNLNLLNNVIYYVGNTVGTYTNNGIYVSNSNGTRITGNKFDLDIVSAYVSWSQLPSGDWTSAPLSEGIVIANSEGVGFEDNVVNVTYHNVVGGYDTVYAIDFKNSDYAMISGNNITVLGHTYIYGIIITAENFNINNNTIKVESDNYYAAGIDIEGPASGVVDNNVIDVKGVESAYAIYSGMNGQNVSAVYIDNNISGEAYSIFGFSLGDDNAELTDNSLLLVGNYTTGIAYRGGNLTVVGNDILLISSEQGNLSIWEGFGIESVGIKVIAGSADIKQNVILAIGKGISLTCDAANIINNTIDVLDVDGIDSYAIYAYDLSELHVLDNNVTFEGNTNGEGINNAVLISNVPGAIISGNNFNLSLVSCYVPWFEIPAGSGNWVSFPVSEGIVVDSSEGAQFENNVVDVKYNNVSGSYDTLYAVDFKDSEYAMISANNITAEGHTYIYGITISGENFNINNNTILVESDNYFAEGIDIEGPASGVVDNNVIDVKGVQSAYAIYSGMNGQNVSGVYIDNAISGEAYNVFGFALGDVESEILSNFITLSGNYTTGIAFRGSNLIVNNTSISAAGSNIGDESVWEAFGVETIGIKVKLGTSEITNNLIISTGSCPVNVFDNVASVHDNMLVGTRFIGDEGVKNADNAVVYNNTPEIGEKNASSIVITEVDGDCNITGILKDAEGNPMADTEVQYSIDGNIAGVVTTDKDGVFKATGLTNGKIELVNLGDSYTANSTIAITLKDIAPTRIATAIEGDNFTQYAIDYYAGERGGNFTVQLKDASGKVLANKVVLIGYNGKCLERITDENGYASVTINLLAANRLTFAVAFLGDDHYDASMSVYLITINKKPVTISAPAKTFKASAKTKSYTVTLSTIKGVDGKTYFGSGKKVTLKLNGVTYTAKTNAKGQATFKLSITKKGTFTANVNYADDNTYESAKANVKIKIS